MLQRITLEHFKCFQKLSLPLAPLTLLSGLNASGKSTSIQVLVLLHQTLTESPGSPGLILNGKNVTLGSAEEVINRLSGRDHFLLGIENEQVAAQWSFKADKNETDKMSAPLAELLWRDFDTGEEQTLTPKVGEPVYQLIPRSDLAASQTASQVLASLYETITTLTYISADRIGPRETYPASSRAQQDGVGARGEYTPWYIHQYADLEIPSAMCQPEVPPQLKRQVEAWLAHFFPGSAFDLQPIERTNQFRLQLRTNAATNFHRPTNVGYGLSHVLPVITGCLGAVAFAQHQKRIAPLVLVENPELHLHPAGQSAMGVFLARAAATGAQVIIETHSDHVLNGIRRAVKQQLIDADRVTLNFFSNQTDDPSASVVQPKLYIDGGIDPWPAGFFDQIEQDLMELL